MAGLREVVVRCWQRREPPPSASTTQGRPRGVPRRRGTPRGRRAAGAKQQGSRQLVWWVKRWVEGRVGSVRAEPVAGCLEQGGCSRAARRPGRSLNMGRGAGTVTGCWWQTVPAPPSVGTSGLASRALRIASRPPSAALDPSPGAPFSAGNAGTAFAGPDKIRVRPAMGISNGEQRPERRSSSPAGRLSAR